MKAETVFRSPKVESYLATMVKHFSQKVEVEETENGARMRFVCGVADILLSPGTLRIRVEAPSREELDMTCDVVERHLLRFAHRETPDALIWQADA